MKKKPVVLIYSFNWDLQMSAQRLYASLRRAGYEIRILRFGVFGLSPNLEDRLLVANMDAELASVMLPPAPEEIQELVETVRRLNPLFVGFSVMSTNYVPAIQVTRALREALNPPIVWGGVHPTFMPEESLRESMADAVCVGEGEEAIVDIARIADTGSRDFSSIDNLCTLDSSGRFRRNPVRPLNPNLDALPFVPLDSKDMIEVPADLKKKAKENASYTQSDINQFHGVMTAFGCPYRCRFCFQDGMHDLYQGPGYRVRTKSVGRVMEECRYGRDQLGKRYIAFWDDIFGLDPQWLAEFCERYPREVDLPFFCYFHPLHTAVDRLDQLKKAGCDTAECGVQSGSERLRREYFGRRETNDQIIEAAKRMNCRFRTSYDVIIDAPFETEEDVRETIRLFTRIPHPFTIENCSYISISGVSLTQRALDAGKITPRDLVWKQAEGFDSFSYWQRRRPVRRHNLYILLAATQHPCFSREEIESWMNDEALLDDPHRLRFEVCLRLLEKNVSEKHRWQDRAREWEDKWLRHEWSQKRRGRRWFSGIARGSR